MASRRRTTARILLLCVAAGVAICTSVPTDARASATRSLVRLPIFGPFELFQCPEAPIIDVKGEIRWLHLEVDGPQVVIDHRVNENVIGTALDGSVYRYIGHFISSSHISPDHSTFTTSFTGRFIGIGPAADAIVTITSHVTRLADGTLSADVNNVSVQCH